jgi:hypothetical protein
MQVSRLLRRAAAKLREMTDPHLTQAATAGSVHPG